MRVRFSQVWFLNPDYAISLFWTGTADALFLGALSVQVQSSTGQVSLTRRICPLFLVTNVAISEDVGHHGGRKTGAATRFWFRNQQSKIIRTPHWTPSHDDALTRIYLPHHVPVPPLSHGAPRHLSSSRFRDLWHHRRRWGVGLTYVCLCDVADGGLVSLSL